MLNNDLVDKYDAITYYATDLMKELDYVRKANVDWELVNLKTALVEVHKTIKNFEDRLRLLNADKQV